MEAVCSSATSFDCHRTTQHYIPEDNALQLCVLCMGGLMHHIVTKASSVSMYKQVN
jgi:hypothetical protein